MDLPFHKKPIDTFQYFCQINLSKKAIFDKLSEVRGGNTIAEKMGNL